MRDSEREGRLALLPNISGGSECQVKETTSPCCCEYANDGHCGVLPGETMDNDATVECFGRTTRVHAGADSVAQSGLMDGKVVAIRAAFGTAGHADCSTLCCNVKYASGSYSPFREAAGGAPSGPGFGTVDTIRHDEVSC